MASAPKTSTLTLLAIADIFRCDKPIAAAQFSTLSVALFELLQRVEWATKLLLPLLLELNCSLTISMLK